MKINGESVVGYDVEVSEFVAEAAFRVDAQNMVDAVLGLPPAPTTYTDPDAVVAILEDAAKESRPAYAIARNARGEGMQVVARDGRLVSAR